MFNDQEGSEVIPVHVLAYVNQPLYFEPGFATMIDWPTMRIYERTV